MTIDELKKSGHIIFECISGSRAYGLDMPNSDTDIRGVFILPVDDFFSLEYIGQVNNESNDIVYYELRKFIDLCASNNPNILEMLNVPERCVLYEHPLFKTISMNVFLSKQCEFSFANYAYSQKKKARGLEKKIVNPMEKERKSILDFCFILDDGKSVEFKKFLSTQKLDQTNCGLSRIPHMRDCYNLYVSNEWSFSGIARNELSNDVNLSNIPKGEMPIAMLFFNKDGYSAYCKKYREYWDWAEKRNEARYSNTIVHGKNYDSKNMMHTFRLLHMAKEIAVEGRIIVERSDREYLLEIKEGKYGYEELVEKAELLKAELVELYRHSSLPDFPDTDLINMLLIQIRKEFYLELEQLST